MPEPMAGQTQEEFMEKCIPMAMSEGMDNDQAVAMCATKWEEHMKTSTPKTEYKSFPLSVQGIEERTVKSLFAVMGHVDDGKDRILPRAFAKTLSERMSRVMVLWQHDATQPPVGKPLLLKEITRDELPSDYKTQFPAATGALYGEVEYLDTPRGNEVLSGIKAGAIRENSIGYDALQHDYTSEGGERVRNLKELRLWDISPVNWGMQPAALNLKSAVERFHVGELDAAGMIPELLRVFTGESKEGRVLSARNLEKLKQALQTLQDILLAAEPPQDEESIFLQLENMKLRVAIAERELQLWNS